MTFFDVFNGDADGICSLVQLRRADRRKATLLTGVKRDIDLLDRVDAKAGDELTVLDISMRPNRPALDRLLARGVKVFYVDHHNAGDIPTNRNLTTAIDTRPDMCTGLLVNKYLKGTHAEWAVVAAFGDNLAASAEATAQPLALTADELATLRQFGELVNYNSYGRSIEDLHFSPVDLYQHLSEFDTPRQCLRAKPEIFGKLKSGYEEDLATAQQSEEVAQTASGAVHILSDAPWARRISGSFGNYLARMAPQRAHAVLTHNIDGSYLVSVRAPREAPQGADRLCLAFETGGGRAGAAGINSLSEAELDRFIAAFHAAWQEEVTS